MGTLTANVLRLDEHCPHKLATSCRLTSTPKCCACADERPHALSYRVYIDGVGYVNRGTRWQSYCWFCKEFWTNRIACADPPIEISQTRIPLVPDQTEFVERWNEFHEGYRTGMVRVGTQRCVIDTFEPFREVSPGFLPRTLREVRTGVANNAQRPQNRLRRQRIPTELQRPEEVSQQSIDDEWDRIINEADSEESNEASAPAPAPAPALVTPHIPELDSTEPFHRSEAVQRLRQRRQEALARVFGTREDVQQADYESPLSSMYNRAYDRYRQAEERRAEGNDVAPPLEGLTAQERREIEDQLLWGVMRESASEELENDVWSYTPVNRSYVPTNRNSRVSSRDTGQPFQDDVPSYPHREPMSSSWATNHPRPSHFGSTPVPQLSTRRPPIPIPVPRRLSTSETANGSVIATSPPPSNPTGNFSDVRTSIQQITTELQRLRLASEAISLARHGLPRSAHNAHGRALSPDTAPTLDNQPARPPPLTDEQMTRNLACQVCYGQIADTAVLPCGHMVMCGWCADVVVPVRHATVPSRPSKCPMCRRGVKQRVKIHVG